MFMNDRAIDDHTIKVPNSSSNISKAVSLAILDIGIMLAVLQVILGILCFGFNISHIYFTLQKEVLFLRNNTIGVISIGFIINLLLAAGTFLWCSLWNKTTPCIRFKGLLFCNAISFVIWLWLDNMSVLTAIISLSATLLLCIGGMGILSLLVMLRGQESYIIPPHRYDRINYIYLLIGIFIFPCISWGLILTKTSSMYIYLYLTAVWIIETLLLYRHAPLLDKRVIVKPCPHNTIPVLQTIVSQLLFWTMIVIILIIWESTNIELIRGIFDSISIEKLSIYNTKGWIDVIKMPVISVITILSGFYIASKIIYFQGIHQAISITALFTTVIAFTTVLLAGIDAGYWVFSLDGEYPILQYIISPIVDYGLSSLLLGAAIALIVSLARNEAFNMMSNRYIILLSFTPIIIITWGLICQYIMDYYWMYNSEKILRVIRAVLSLTVFLSLFHIMDSETDFRK